jgi:hypothetical protein
VAHVPNGWPRLLINLVLTMLASDLRLENVPFPSICKELDMLSICPGAVTFWFFLSAAIAGDPAADANVCSGCGKAGVETLVYVPTWTTEKRTCKETCYRTEERKCIRTVCKKVPVTKPGVIKKTVYVPKVIETKREVEISTPVSTMVEQKYHIQVPVKEKVTKTRMITKCVPIPETRKVCVDGVEKEITETCNREVCIPETDECEVDACAEVEQSRMVRVWETKKEIKVVIDRRETVEPVVQVKTVPVTFCENQTEEITETCTVCVPYVVEKEVEVPVCKMVPRKIVLPCDCCNK